MSACRKCNSAGSSTEPLVACDRCAVTLCKSCALLSSTELRAVCLQKKTINFFCSGCQSQQFMLGSPDDLQAAIRNVVREELSDFVNLIATRVSAELHSELNSIHNEVAFLRQSNVDLVRLLTEGPRNLLHPAQDVTTAPSLHRKPVSSKPLQTSNNRKITAPASHNSDQQARSLTVEETQLGLKKLTGQNTEPTTSGNSDQALSVPVPQSYSAAVLGSAQRQHSAIVGSRKLNDPTIYAAKVQKKTSIYIGRLDKQVSEDALRSYLRSTFGDAEDFSIHEQKVRSGDYRSFRVEARLELLDDLLCSSNWPENILVKKFRFFRQRTLPSNNQ